MTSVQLFFASLGPFGWFGVVFATFVFWWIYAGEKLQAKHRVAVLGDAVFHTLLLLELLVTAAMEILEVLFSKSPSSLVAVLVVLFFAAGFFVQTFKVWNRVFFNSGTTD